MRDTEGANAGRTGQPLRKVRWTVGMRRTFFAHLAAHCNVTAAAAAIGLTPAEVHDRRRRHQPFAAEWDQAIAAGMALLEMRLIGRVLAETDDGTKADSPDPEPIDWDHAIKLYTVHRAQRGTRHGQRDPSPTVATPEQTNAAILRKLASIDAGRARRTGRQNRAGAGA